ncbi:MAG: SAM-dependent methyltransferase, partial [Deltaproteobacteria bacterium]
MNEDRVIELMVKMHDGLPRLGPGNAESTLKALSCCHELPPSARILDVGCGTGSQTLILAAELSDARIAATDLSPNFLTQLKTEADRQGWVDRIEIKEADMNALPFPENSFDLIWSEGAVYIMGFDQGLTKWRPLVRPGGYLVVSEISWFHSDPPAELKDYWQEQYPGIRHVEENLAAAESLGWKPIANFHLPDEAWIVDYYGPLRKRLPLFRRENAEDEDAQAIADMTEQEMKIITANF